MTIAQDHPYGFSPNSSASHEFDDPLEDDFAYGDDEHSYSQSDETSVRAESAAPQTKPKRSNNRKGPANVDKRNLHNATERARRNGLNDSFLELADALPALKQVKRPSKAVVIASALEHVLDAQKREHVLTNENNDLRREVDQLRAQLGMPPLPPPAPLPETKKATQSTMRKSKKATERPVKARTVTAETLPAVSQAESPFAAAVATAKVEFEAAALPLAGPSPPTSYSASPASYAHSSPTSIFDSPPPLSSSPPTATAATLPIKHPFPFSAPPAAAPAYAPPQAYNPAAALFHAQQAAQLAGMLGAAGANALQPTGANAFTGYLNPHLLFQQLAMQQQHQHQQQQQQHQHQQVQPSFQDLFGGACGAGMPNGLFANPTEPTLW